MSLDAMQTPQRPAAAELVDEERGAGHARDFDALCGAPDCYSTLMLPRPPDTSMSTRSVAVS
jgi:hypothetical protein